MIYSSPKRGFTLIELMIVIAIIGILAAIAVPNFRKAREQARTKACHANQRVLMGAVEMYNIDNATPMDTLDQQELIDNNYLRSWSYCPELPTTAYATLNKLSEGTGRIVCPAASGFPAHLLNTQ